jgi:hypothetical protein
MVIHYCEKCGVRIAPAEVESGAARVNEEGKAICSKCAPSRRTSTRLTVGSTPRDSRLGIKPARRDSKIRIEPAAPLSPAKDVSAPPPDLPKEGQLKRNVLIGGAAAAVVLIIVLAIALGGSTGEPSRSDTTDETAQTASAPVLPPTIPSTPPPTKDTPLERADEPKTEEVKKEPDGYDPRATVAQSILEQAKAGFKENPNDPWTYQEKLQALVNDHGPTPAGKEAATILATLNPGPKPADPALPPEEDWLKARDLLALADPAKHAIDGGWTLENGALLSQSKGRIRLALPYTLPDEYDLKVVLTRVDGGNNLCINLTHVGKPLTFHLAAWGNKVAGWEMLDNKRINEISTTLHRNNILENNRRYTLILQMRKERWAAYLDGQVLVKRNRDVNRAISQFKDLMFPNPKLLGFLTNGSAYRLDEIKVLEVTGSGKVLSDAEIAETAKTPDPASPSTPVLTTPEKPSPASADQHKASAYAVWLKTFLSHWSRSDWATARRCVDEALKSPELATRSAELNLDRECLALADSAQQAIPKGAELLKDGRAFTLEETKGKKYVVGKKTKVLEVEANSLKIQADIGGGQIIMDLTFASLTPETLFELARIGLPDDGKGKLALAFYRFPSLLKSVTPEAQRFFDALQAQAEKAEAPAELLARLSAWLGILEREKLAEKALHDIEQLIAGKKGLEAQAALDDFIKSYADTAFVEESQEALTALRTQLAPLLLQPGLIAKYYSGDEKNKRKTFHSSQIVKALDNNWADKGPAEGVPTDNFLVEFTGLLRITEAGEYAFSWGADDHLEVWLDGKSYGKNKTGQKIDLQPDDHPIKLVFVEGGGNASMWVKWKPPGDKAGKKITTENLVHNPADEEGTK